MVQHKRFFRQAMVMMTGTAIAQAIPLLVAPILTRLYTPAQFGVLSAVVAFSAILAVLSTLRYELAIVLPKSETAAVNLFAFAATSTTLTVLLFLTLLFAVPHLVDALPGAVRPLYWIIGIFTFCLATTQILSFVATRALLYRWIATALVIQQVVAGVLAVLLAYASWTAEGLIWGRVGGQICAALVLLIATWPWLSRKYRAIRPQIALAHARRYIQFPKFNVPYSFVGTFSREFLIVLLVAFGQPAVAGQYGLARSVLTAPITFLSSSLSQVFYKEAAVGLGTVAFNRLTVMLLVSIAAALTPLFVFGAFWTPVVFEWVFGQSWRDAGVYATIMMPIAFLSLFTSWPERIFEVSGRQQISLMIQVTFDGLSIAAVFLAFHFKMPAVTAIGTFVGIQILYHFSYLGGIFHLSKLGWRNYTIFVLYLLSLISITTMLELFIYWLSAPTLIWFVLNGLIAAAMGGLSFLAARAGLVRFFDTSVEFKIG